MRLPSDGLYPQWALAGAAIICGAATVAHGSGFLAVFLAGILIGDVLDRAGQSRAARVGEAAGAMTAAS